MDNWTPLCLCPICGSLAEVKKIEKRSPLFGCRNQDCAAKSISIPTAEWNELTHQTALATLGKEG